MPTGMVRAENSITRRLAGRMRQPRRIKWPDNHPPNLNAARSSCIPKYMSFFCVIQRKTVD